MTHVPWHPDEMESAEFVEVTGIESVELLSVGIDIGTTTTQLLLSRMVARRAGGEYSSKFRITERETIYESPIRLTPYHGQRRIDMATLADYIDGWYADAGCEPDDIDTGAVIITGEANRKDNAERIIDLFASRSGRFVCATAGANLETLMAAHGSGAVTLSVDEEVDVLNVDIGGGTMKLALVAGGFVKETAVINVGARLIAFDDEGRIERLEDAGSAVGDDIDMTLSAGDSVSAADRRRLATRFATLLFELIDGSLSPLAESLTIVDPPDDTFDFDVITFSGGGSEYIYGRDAAHHNDLGQELGTAILDQVDRRGLHVEELDTGIRATAIGSNQHTVQVSGNTITITDESLLPIRNVPIVPFVVDSDDDSQALVEAVGDKLELYDADVVNGPFAFGFHLHGVPSYATLKRIIDAAVSGSTVMDGSGPLIFAFDADVALSVGRIATESVDRPVIAVDGVELSQFGYIDIGEPLDQTDAVPLTIKSLLFEG